VNRNGFRKVSSEQARQQTITALLHLRDGCIRMAKDSLSAGEWRAALTCLDKAAIYNDQRTALARGGDASRGYCLIHTILATLSRNRTNQVSGLWRNIGVC